MRKVVVTEFMTLDGVISNESSWQGPFRSDEARKFKLDELFASGALLLGRVTYEGFAQYWPFETNENAFADRMNGLPKYVASTTLTELTWNAHLLTGDISAAVAALKQEPGQDILVLGSGDFVQTLMQHDLVDEYHLMVHPIVQGSGKRLFRDGSHTKTLELVETKMFDKGVVVLIYAPAREA